MAHVDAGKTTLSEQLLYLGGAVRERGRVDHGDAFLDTEPVERERGITVFSGQADFTWGDTVYYLLDTPGHTDFAAETERVLPALDYAVLVVSCAEGVQGHTETLWRLLRDYGVPVFLFLNKLDRPGADLQRTMDEARPDSPAARLPCCSTAFRARWATSWPRRPPRSTTSCSRALPGGGDPAGGVAY